MHTIDRNHRPLHVTGLAGLLVLACCLPAVAGETLSGKVVSIADGDTLTVLVGKVQHKIRVSDIDCPERRQPFGTKARQFTGKLAFGEVVTVRAKDHQLPVQDGSWGQVVEKRQFRELIGQRAAMTTHYPVAVPIKIRHGPYAVPLDLKQMVLRIERTAGHGQHRPDECGKPRHGQSRSLRRLLLGFAAARCLGPLFTSGRAPLAFAGRAGKLFLQLLLGPIGRL